MADRWEQLDKAREAKQEPDTEQERETVGTRQREWQVIREFLDAEVLPALGEIKRKMEDRGAGVRVSPNSLVEPDGRLAGLRSVALTDADCQHLTYWVTVYESSGSAYVGHVRHVGPGASAADRDVNMRSAEEMSMSQPQWKVAAVLLS